jgi:pimeloyl-ACP methyl ester carboxylesterase
MTDNSQRLQRPSLLLLLSEGRALVEFGATIASVPALIRAPRGDGHPVLVLPGFLAGDRSTTLIRRYLAYLGYIAYPWNLGRNNGGVYRMRSAIWSRIEEISRQSGRKVSLVGWSLGGVYARDAAFHMPDKVRSVITLGSPFAKDVSASNAQALYERISGETPGEADPADIKALGDDMPVPATAIYSKTDGIVNWRSSVLEENHNSENIEILCGSHVGLGLNAAVLWAIADRLCMPEGEFWPFDPAGPFNFAYQMNGKRADSIST